MFNLRGKVYSRFKSITAMARTLGWTKQKASRIVNGLQEPTIDDVKSLSDALDEKFEDVAAFFLHN